MKRFDLPVFQDCFRIVNRRSPVAAHARRWQADHSFHRHEHSRRSRSCRQGAGQGGLILMHTCSTYPAAYEELNLHAIPASARTLRNPGWLFGPRRRAFLRAWPPWCWAACCVERHITMDRAMWGSDQAASLEPNGISRLVRDIRLIEQSMGDGSETRLWSASFPLSRNYAGWARRLQSAHEPCSIACNINQGHRA